MLHSDSSLALGWQRMQITGALSFVVTSIRCVRRGLPNAHDVAFGFTLMMFHKCSTVTTFSDHKSDTLC